MSSLLLLLTSGPSSVDGLEFDAATVETHEYSSSVTGYPIEDGSVISDHVVNNPLSISIDAVFSDSPLPSQVLKRAIASGPSVETILPENAATQWGKLVDIWRAREPVDVVTELEEYENMLITGLRTARSADIGNSVYVECELVQVNIVNSETTAVPVDANSAAAVKNKGKKATKDAAEGASDKALGFSLLKGAIS